MPTEINASVIRLFVDGSGSRPDGNGSCFAFFRPDTGASGIERIDGLSNNQAEYRAVLLGLQSVPEKNTIEILTDSQLVACQFNGYWRALDPTLAVLLTQVHRLIQEKHLIVSVAWIPRRENLAGRLI